MSGVDNEMNELNAFIQDPSKITVSANAVLDDVTKNWVVTFILMGSGFSMSEVKAVGKGKPGETTAKDIADKINNFQKRYDTMKEALELCLPDEIESNDNLNDYQKFLLTEARKIIES